MNTNGFMQNIFMHNTRETLNKSTHYALPLKRSGFY